MSINVEYTNGGNGDCFESSLHALVDRKWVDYTPYADPQDWRLVHTMCLGQGPIEGVRFGHGFLLNKELRIVLDIANGKGGLIPALTYFALGGVDPDQFPYYEYDLKQVRENMLKHETYGPWGDAYNEITKIEAESLAAASIKNIGKQLGEKH
tara:strand:+ start:165 stop:623 length:459 start_codon:yes stop_codon:yes gene_type:complete